MEGTCKLCGESKTLSRSHVLPEFFYRSAYDDSHTFLSVTNLPQHRPRKMQKGLWERLLCGRCEKQFSRYEVYASRLLSQADVAFENGSHLVQLPGVDYKAFRLFALSLLWRMHVSTLHMFADVRLGPLASPLRARLLSEQLGPPHEYGFLIARVMGLDTHGDMIIAPLKWRYRDATAYLLMARGYEWVFFASAGSERLMGHVPFVGAESILSIPGMEQDRDELFQQLRRSFPQSLKR